MSPQRKDPTKGSKPVQQAPGGRFGVRLAVLVALIILPLYTLVILNIRAQYLQDRQDIYESASRLTGVIIEAQSDLIRSLEPLLAAISRIDEVRRLDGPACSAILSELLKSSEHYLNIAAVTADGAVFCSAVPAPPGANVSDLAWFRRTMANGRFAAGDFEVGKVTGQRSFSFGYPVRGEDGALLGAVYVSLDLRSLGDIIQAADVPPGTVLTEVDRNATVIARYPDIPGIVGNRLPDEPVVRNVMGPLASGTFMATGLDDVERLYAFSQLDPAAASSPYVIVGFEREALFAQLRRTLLFNILGLLAVTLIVLFLAYEGSKEIVLRRVEAMEDVERLRNEFIALASHQLRTPVTSVRWLLELLLSGKPEPLTPGQAELAEEARRSADHLARLVKELVEVERGGLGVTVAAVPCDAAAVVRAAVEESRTLAARRKVTIEEDLQPGLPRAMCDPVLLRQVVANLLTNALKYSSPGGIVTVSVRAAGAKARVEVVDRGIGIPVAEQKHVFERFYRASNVRELQGEGLGLGLHLSKLFVERMGGKIGFISKEGRGTTFWAEFPKAP